MTTDQESHSKAHHRDCMWSEYTPDFCVGTGIWRRGTPVMACGETHTVPISRMDGGDKPGYENDSNRCFSLFSNLRAISERGGLKN